MTCRADYWGNEKRVSAERFEKKIETQSYFQRPRTGVRGAKAWRLVSIYGQDNTNDRKVNEMQSVTKMFARPLPAHYYEDTSHQTWQDITKAPVAQQVQVLGNLSNSDDSKLNEAARAAGARSNVTGESAEECSTSSRASSLSSLLASYSLDQEDDGVSSLQELTAEYNLLPDPSKDNTDCNAKKYSGILTYDINNYTSND